MVEAKQERFAIEITRSHCLGGARGDVFAGTVLKVPADLSAVEARTKVASGYAITIDEDEAGGEPEVTAPGSLETRDPELGIRDPEPAAKPATRRKPGRGTKARRGK